MEKRGSVDRKTVFTCGFFARCFALLSLLLLAFLPVAFGTQPEPTPAKKTSEVQRHGVDFEQWVREEFFNGYEAPYTSKWDIPASVNHALPKPYRGLPVSVKCAKIGRPIDLADALRQRSIDEPFVIIIGLWNQRTPAEKWIEEIICLRIEPSAWKALWGSLTHDDIVVLDTAIKERTRPVAEVRAFAAQWKRDHRGAGNTIAINYKIDAKGQRRVQCSLPLDALLAAASTVERGDMLFKRTFPNPIISTPRGS